MDDLPDTPEEPELLPDYQDSPWLRPDEGPTFRGDPETQAIFAQALAFLEVLTAPLDASDFWPETPPAILIHTLQQHNRRAQEEGQLLEDEEVTLLHLKAVSRRWLLAIEETGWSLTHYDHQARWVDHLIDQTIVSMTGPHNPQLTYEVLLASLPPEDLVEYDDPAYADFETDGGCRTCTSGQPCWARIEEDIGEILARSGLPATEELACLQWLMATGYSSLTHSLDRLAEEFTAIHQQAAEQRAATVLVFEANGNDLLVLPIDLARTEANLLELAQQEAARLNLSIEQVTLRFAAG